jgi:hypothetical protein
MLVKNRALALAAAALAALATGVSGAQAGTVEMTSCSGFGDGAADGDVSGAVWQGTSNGSFSTANRCVQGGSFQIIPSGYPHKADSARWQTTAPPSIQIVHAVTPFNDVLIDPHSGSGFRSSFFWNGGSLAISPVNNCCGGMYFGSGINRWLGPSHTFGWRVMCAIGRCGVPLQILDVRGIDLVGVDNSVPRLLALGSNNIWYQASKWIRGSGWPASFQSTDDSGVCAMSAAVAGQPIPGPTALARNTHSWTQCPPTQRMDLTIDTTRYSNGPLPLKLGAADAANPANVAAPSETLRVDNQPVSLRLTGPSDSSFTAGTQYVTAIASAGPSGVAIGCSVDGSRSQIHLGPAAEIPVSGLGVHRVLCFAQNGAMDPSGNPARTALQSWTIKIGAPSVMRISFTHVIKPRCHLVHVAGHRQPHRKVAKQRRCHPPRVTDHLTHRVPHGHSAAVSGWLGTANGTPLGAQQIELLTAPDDGQHRFGRAATVTTKRNGTWRAKLAPGPSRLVVALYRGGPLTEGAFSPEAHLLVPAKIKLLSISPRHVPWGGTVRITGQLLGGYLPPGGALVRLRIGFGHSFQTYGIQEHVIGNGLFSTTYTFGAGSPSVRRTFWFEVASLPMGNYPYAPAASKRIMVSVGG